MYRRTLCKISGNVLSLFICHLVPRFKDYSFAKEKAKKQVMQKLRSQSKLLPHSTPDFAHIARS